MNVAVHAQHHDELSILDACAGFGMLGEAVKLGLAAIGIRSRIALHVERDSAAAAALVARMEKTNVDRAPVWDDLATFDGRRWRGCVDIFAAGLPCQPYSNAGKRTGNTDHRSFGEDGSGPVVHALRIIEETGPALVFLENVPAWVTGGHFRSVGDELCRMGYEIQEPLFVAASDVGAPHERERVFVMAVADAEFDGWWKHIARWRQDRGGVVGRAGIELGNAGGPASERDAGSLCGTQTPVDGERLTVNGAGGQRSSDAIVQLADDQRYAKSTNSREPNSKSNGRHDAGGRGAELALSPRGGCGVGGESSERDRQPERRSAGQARAGDERSEARGVGQADAGEPRRKVSKRRGASGKGSSARGSASEFRGELGDAISIGECESQCDKSAEPRIDSRHNDGGRSINVGDSAGVRLERLRAENSDRSGRMLVSGESSSKLPLFPPGRGDVANPNHPDWWGWAAVAEMAAALMPRTQQHIPALVDGMARSDELRIGGNGVVPVAAAFAFARLLIDRCKREGIEIVNPDKEAIPA